MPVVTLRLDQRLDEALARLAERTGRTKSAIAREALERQLAVARFRELRLRALPLAEARAVLTDDDIPLESIITDVRDALNPDQPTPERPATSKNAWPSEADDRTSRGQGTHLS